MHSPLTSSTTRASVRLPAAYYTPDFIVKYIVDQAVGPTLRGATAGAKTDADKVKAVLALNVLDPAMGSGHFLVEVVEYIARYLVDLGIAPTTASPLGAGGGEGGDLAYWKRRVAQSCVYGVDLNPLAVELAKLSLWLVTVAKDRPLSFLDHHLRAGNSLVGAKLDDVRQFALTPKKRARKSQANAEAQAPLFSAEQLRQDMFSAVGSMFLIEANPALTVDDVKLQEQTYLALRDDLTRKYKLLADLMTSERFGLALDPALLPALAARATGRSSMAMRQIDEVMAQAEAMAAERRFFHWEIEFPEVFFDRAGEPQGEQAGFDAVVGNPPYVRQEQLALFKPYFKQAYAEVYDGTADLFVYFFARGVSLLQQGGRLSYIASNSWLRANYATPLRVFMRTQVTVESLVDLGDNRVFADAPDVYPAIPVVRRAAPNADHAAQVATFNRGEGLAGFDRRLADKLAPVSIHDQDDTGWQLGNSADRQVLQKLLANGTEFGEYVNKQIYLGIKSGLNEAFVIDESVRNRLIQGDPSSANLIYPLKRGEDLRPWFAEDEGRYLIGIPNQWTRQEFGADLSEDSAWQLFSSKHPTVAAYLEPFAEPARKRGDKGEFWWELRPCDYYAEFDKPKVFWPDIAKSPRFVWDNATTRIGNTGYFTSNAGHELLGVLSSRAIWFALSQLGQAFGERAGVQRYRLFTQSMERLPIPDMTDAQRRAIADLALRITEQATARYALHRAVRHRIASDLASGSKLNQKLTAWWDLPNFAAFRTELKKALKADIPLGERDDWERWLAERRAEHARYTDEIVRLETKLNAQVYALFNLTTDEISLIEASTKYRYGEV